MRRSNWKVKALFVVACVIGIILGIVQAFIVPEPYTGLAVFGTIVVVAGIIIFVGVRVLRIGDE